MFVSFRFLWEGPNLILDILFRWGNNIVVGAGRRNPLSAAMLVTCLPCTPSKTERLDLKNDGFQVRNLLCLGVYFQVHNVCFCGCNKYTNKRQLQYHSFCPTDLDKKF